MDGTLLNSKGEVSPKFFPLMKELRNFNIRFAVASGRQYYSLINTMQEVKDDLMFIAENGAIAMRKGERVHIQPMESSVALELVERLKKVGGKYIIVCGEKAAYIEQTDPQFMDPFLRHYDNYEVVEDLLKLPDDEILKVTVCDLSGAEENTLPHVEYLKEGLQVKLSGEIWIDFTHKLAQKGNALLKIQEKYQITPEETMAFGDYLNDLELFDHASFSFAMENAHDEVKQKARFTAKTNDEEGVVQILENLLKDKKDFVTANSELENR